MADLPIVRIAQPSDADEVMAMCRRLWSENGIFTFDENKVRNLLQRCFDRKGTIVGVIGEPGRIEASTCLGIGDFYYTGDWHLEEFWNFVDVKYRKSKNADALIEFGMQCSDTMGIPFFTGIITAKQMAGKVRLYRRRLGHPIGAYFMYGANLNLTPKTDDYYNADYSDLQKSITDFIGQYSNRGISANVVKGKLIPLLREALALVKKTSDNDFWVADTREAAKLAVRNGAG